MDQLLSLPVEIPLRKRKLFILTCGIIAFIAIGCWFMVAPPQSGNDFFTNPVLLRVAGVAVVIFFGVAGYFMVRNLLSDKAGLIIDSTGISDLSGAASAEKIYWKDVEEIGVLTIRSQQLIMIRVSNPQEYISGQKSRFKRKLMELNYKWYGSPFGISGNNLEIPFGELLQLITRVHKSAARPMEQGF